jgi:hypothetical protein
MHRDEQKKKCPSRVLTASGSELYCAPFRSHPALGAGGSLSNPDEKQVSKELTATEIAA